LLRRVVLFSPFTGGIPSSILQRGRVRFGLDLRLSLSHSKTAWSRQYVYDASPPLITPPHHGTSTNQRINQREMNSQVWNPAQSRATTLIFVENRMEIRYSYAMIDDQLPISQTPARLRELCTDCLAITIVHLSEVKVNPS
jgi:hypothetical protein